MKNVYLNIILVLFLVYACGQKDAETVTDGSVKTENVVPVGSLDIELSAPDTLDLLDNKFVLDVDIRLVPKMSGLAGYDFVARVHLNEVNRKPIYQAYVLDRITVVNGDSAWTSAFTAEVFPDKPDYALVSVARGGPIWPAGTSVDVYVSVYDEAHQESYLIMAQNVAIEAEY